MSNSFVRVPPDSTGKRIDNTELTVDGNVVYRQRIALGDGTSNNLASVDADGNLSTVLHGTNDAGTVIPIPVTAEGHLEVALHAPRLPFGSVHTESLTPIMQTDCVYGLNAGQVISGSTLSGSVTDTDNLFSVSTGTTIYSQAFVQGRKRLRYRPGQGVIGRFTALYTSPVANSYQVVGFGHAESGVYFGYVGTDFGILYVSTGIRHTVTLTVATGATSASNATITLNGTAFTVPLTAASNIYRSAYEIANFTYAGWKTTQVGATVIFVNDSAGNKAGAFTFGAGTTGAAASFATTLAGVASTDTFIPQSTWNGDTLLGTGASGVTLDPTKGNVFEIGIQYLGFGSVSFKVEVIPPTGNNADFVTVHTLRLPNSLTAVSFRNPAFPFSMAVYSAGSTTNLTTKVGSYAGFIEGGKNLHGNRFTYFKQLTTVGDTNFQALFTIMNSRYYKGKANQCVINLISTSGAIKHTSPVIYYLIKGGTLVGNPNFVALSADSCSVYDTAATTVTYATGEQLLWTGHIGDTGEIDHHFGNGSFNAEELTLQPGEWITLAAKSTTGTPAYVTGSINTREDQ